MDLLEVMTNRRSVRSYTEEEIPAEKLEKILQAGLLAESGKNLKPWEFVITSNKSISIHLFLIEYLYTEQ